MSLISSVEKINSLIAVKLVSGRPVKCKKFVQYQNMVIAVLENGRIWTNWQQFRKFALMPSKYDGPVDHFCRCLRSLGLITRAEFEEHQTFTRRHIAERTIRWDQDRLDKLAKDYGFKTRKLKRRIVKP